MASSFLNLRQVAWGRQKYMVSLGLGSLAHHLLGDSCELVTTYNLDPFKTDMQGLGFRAGLSNY